MATPASLRAFEMWTTRYKRMWRSGLTASLLSPLLFLTAMGLGLGSLVNNGPGAATFGGVNYVSFIAPGLLAAAAIQIAAAESMWPVLGSIKWDRTYHAMLATPLIATLIQHSADFTAHDVLMSRAALVAYSVGLTGIILVKVLAPGFYAQQNIKTPVKIAIATLVVTQLFNLVFVPVFQHAGLALSIGLGACVNAGMLYFFMRRQGIFKPQPHWLMFLLKLVIALALMGGGLWLASGLDSEWLTQGTLTKAWRLTWVIALGMALYFSALWLMGFRLSDFSRRAAS